MEIGCMDGNAVGVAPFCICTTHIDSPNATISKESPTRPFVERGEERGADDYRKAVHMRPSNWQHGMMLPKRADF
jgi:hypothetical protein